MVIFARPKAQRKEIRRAIAFPNQERLISPSFSNLDLTAAQILAGR
ncbi:hypothetical protein H6G33_14795 [Calothrix sp. FACHB-1219]|nr:MULTISPECIES: hypothetical protein [unclassified Calothrix]MBD2203912.1 hypothetical protein [Calothrix sp. FACHB-168]MBD2218303.1 hypothetical protein [Calothrix sp. FACHB-1219]